MLKTAATLSVFGIVAIGFAGMRVCLADDTHQCAIGDAYCTTAAAKGAQEEDVPIACSLSEREIIERRDAIRERLSVAAKNVHLDERRLTVDFPSDHLDPVIEFIKLESDCCRFFSFILDVPPGNRDITLTLAGPKGSEAFLQSIGEAMTPAEVE